MKSPFMFFMGFIFVVGALLMSGSSLLHMDTRMPGPGDVVAVVLVLGTGAFLIRASRDGMVEPEATDSE